MNQDEQMNKSDHDLLIETNTIMRRIVKWCYNHDVHHFRYNVMAWTITAGLLVALILALVKG